MEKELVLYSNDEFYDFVLHYICSHEDLSKNVTSFRYLSESNLRPYEYRPRRYKGKNKEKKVKICALEDTSFTFDFDYSTILFRVICLPLASSDHISMSPLPKFITLSSTLHVIIIHRLLVLQHIPKSANNCVVSISTSNRIIIFIT